MKLTAVPTVVEETYKIVDEAKTNTLKNDINSLEQQREKQRLKQAVIPILNKTKQRQPLVKSISLECVTFKEVLDTILSLQDTESFWAIALLYEYMEIKNCFNIKKLTGTELLKLSGYKYNPNQKQRNRILSCILRHSNTKINILDPERTLKNYKNKKTEEGKSYKIFEFLKIKRVNYSKKNPDLIVSLEEIEFLPDYIEFLPIISRRYIPLEQIRKIPKRTSNDKARHFIIKICFKFASIKGDRLNLNIEQCMNLGKFNNRSNMKYSKRIWMPIERALNLGQEVNLLNFQWNLRKPSKNEIKRDKLEVNNEDKIKFNIGEKLNDVLYKYIQSVCIIRTYDLNYKIELPFKIDQVQPTNSIDNKKIAYY